MTLKTLASGIVDRINAYYINKYLNIPEEKYPQIQRTFLTRQLRRAQKNVPFYRKLLKGQKITNENCFEILSQLPIMTKQDLRTLGSNVYASFVDKNWRKWFNTGGSTGEPFHFPIGGNSQFELKGELFCQAQLYTRMVGNWHCKISSVDGRKVSEEEKNNKIFWGSTNKNFPYGTTHYSAMYLNAENFPYYLKALNSDKPEVLRGYPSGIYELARLIKETKSPLSFDLKAVYLTSENILDYQVKLIEETFNCKVWGQYGHSEASIFAVRCPNNIAYECSPLYGLVEILRPDGSHVGVGEMGEITVTGFQYSALPFIRYKTGDLAVYGGNRNGVVILDELLGRNNDYIINKQGNKLFLAGLLFGAHIKTFNIIETWQIIQNQPGILEIKIVKTPKYSKEDEIGLTEFFSNYGFITEIQYTDHISKTSRGKQQFMIQNLKNSSK